MTKAHEDMGPIYQLTLPGFDGLEGDAATRAYHRLGRGRTGERQLEDPSLAGLAAALLGHSIPSSTALVRCGAGSRGDLPVNLPDVAFTGTGNLCSRRPHSLRWIAPRAVAARRETDTMDTSLTAGIMRHGRQERGDVLDADVADRWMNVDFYCGIEHAQMHLIYARLDEAPISDFTASMSPSRACSAKDGQQGRAQDCAVTSPPALALRARNVAMPWVSAARR